LVFDIEKSTQSFCFVEICLDFLLYFFEVKIFYYCARLKS